MLKCDVPRAVKRCHHDGMRTLLASIASLTLIAALPAADGLLPDATTVLATGTVANCQVSLVDVEGRQGKVLRFQVAEVPKEGWMSHAYAYGVEIPVKTGETVEITGWSRLVDGTEGAIKVDLSESERPYAAVVTGWIMPVAGHWRQFSMKGVATKDMSQVRFGLCVGYRKQTVEVAEIAIRKVGSP